MSRNTTIAIVIVIVLALGYYVYVNSGGSRAPQADTTSSAAQTSSNQIALPPTTTTTNATTAKTVTVHYTSTGFSPSVVTINKGDTVTFVADPNSDEMWIASDPHPTHQGYDGTTKSEHCASDYTGPAPFDECSSAGTSFSFTFEKTGTWGYHNHGNSSDKGTVIVQ
jgi:plastocyanin